MYEDNKVTVSRSTFGAQLTGSNTSDEGPDFTLWMPRDPEERLYINIFNKGDDIEDARFYLSVEEERAMLAVLARRHPDLVLFGVPLISVTLPSMEDSANADHTADVCAEPANASV